MQEISLCEKQDEHLGIKRIGILLVQYSILYGPNRKNNMDWQTYNQLCAMRRFNWLRDMRLIDRILADPIERSSLPSATIATLQENRRELDTKLSIY
jgi:hypothetical protein